MYTIVFFVVWILLNFILLSILNSIDKYMTKGRQGFILGIFNVAFIPIAVFASIYTERLFFN